MIWGDTANGSALAAEEEDKILVDPTI